ncbi:HAD-superfamily hydrolase [Paenibacillus algicola]|uniref:HAD-superfamily hydrolase n=1 Tax=Paenibacillus algicola TaxID=2565926 RepID=A0A4P8XP08_9BACL|nr:HAD family phosphatase [Paenibacillus algicola]QCT02069.1 HAD-superfamily hydrolase [Paenibacillus algicola]
MPVLEIQERRMICSGLLFDKDGTLLHFMSLWGGWASYMLQALEERLELIGKGFTGSRDKVLGTLQDSLGQLYSYDRKGPLAMATAEETIGLLAWQLYAAGMPWNEALLQVRQMEKNAMVQVRQTRPAFPMPGLNELLKQCRTLKLPLAVVTSDTTAAAKEHLAWMGLLENFPVIIGRDQVKQGKPGPDMALAACRQLGLQPEEVAVIGDSNGDMQMAKQAGCALAIGLYEGDADHGDAQHLVDADLIISDYNEIRLKA